MDIHELLRQDPEIWDLFTRKEEYSSTIRDKYDRFPYYASKSRDIFEPKASQYLVEHGFTFDYPGDAPFAVCLTHDIDVIHESIPQNCRSVFRHLKRGDANATFSSIARKFLKTLPPCTFPEIMDLEEKYGARSTFFFMAEDCVEPGYTYEIEDLEPEIGNIIDRGWEVGLHGEHTTYLSAQEMKKKKKRLEKVTHTPVIGYRNHFLHFKVPDTWEFLSKTGFQYDSTLGYADCVGFRNGMCHPFKPFNLNTNHEIDILELPLIVMDGTLDTTYMRLEAKSKLEHIKMLIDRIEACHGVFTLLWHNTHMTGQNLELYERILQHCNERKAWMRSGNAIAQFWKEQSD